MTHSFPTRRSSDLTRIDKEGPTDLGEADAAAYAFEQLNPKFRFESSDSARDIWRVDTKPCRGTPKGEFLGSHNERPNLNQIQRLDPNIARGEGNKLAARSEEHTSELQSLMRNSYAVFCLKKNKNKSNNT